MPKPQDKVSKRAEELERVIDETLQWGKERTDEWEHRRFPTLARALAEYCAQQYWREKYNSVEHFLNEKARQWGVKSHQTMRSTLWVGMTLAEHLTDDEMLSIGKSRLYIVAQEAHRSGKPPGAELLERARTMKVEELRASIKRPLLKGEKSEDLDLVKIAAFFVSREEREHIHEVFDLGREIEKTSNRNALLVHACDIASAHWTEQSRRQLEMAGAAEPPEPEGVDEGDDDGEW